MTKNNNFNIVHEQNFIRATRNTGYRSTASAIAELVDNAIQAKATRIDIVIDEYGIGREKDFSIIVTDNGHGMDSTTLRTALRFGGSTRFDDRSGQGRFGMGLPNASLSQARRLDVYSWQKPGKVIASHIDVDEIASGDMTVVPSPRHRNLPDVKIRLPKQSGTVVVWSRCDLLDNRRAATVARKLHPSLGRQFRYFLWDKLTIRINGEEVKPIDPLFLQTEEKDKATVFGTELNYELHIPNSQEGTSKVTVRFTELPIFKWHSLSVEEKRNRGISKGAGASIIRAGREVDFGWFLFGEKRKENYDDWWRCEISYQPELDEYFGVTHSKQAINPTSELREIMCNDMASIAQLLNSRARKAYAAVKETTVLPSPAAVAATRNDKFLSRTANQTNEKTNGRASRKSSKKKLRYKVQHRRLNSGDFYMFQQNTDGLVTITLNTDHAFFDKFYRPFSEVLKVEDRQVIECFLLAAVRAELGVVNKDNLDLFEQFRRAWSDALEAFLDA